MNKWFSIVLAGLFLFMGCATAPVWHPLFPPEVKVNQKFSVAWPKIVAAVTDDWDIDFIDRTEGYLQTVWKVKRDFLGQNDSRRRVVIRTKNKEPLEMEIKVVVQKPIFASDDAWQDAGNDIELEEKIRSKISQSLLSTK